MAGIYLHIPFCRQKCNYCNFFSLATTKFRDAFFQALLKEIYLTRDYLGDEPIETIYFGGGTPSLLPVSRLEEIIDKVQGSKFKVQEKSHEARRTKDVGRGTSREFSTANCQLPTGNCLLPTANCQLPNADCQFREITLEMNPDDVTPEYLEALSHSAIHRLSLGVQSFFDEDLQYLSRNHDGRQAVKAIEMIRDTGYKLQITKRSEAEFGEANYELRDAGCRMPDKKPVTSNQQPATISIDLIYGIPTLTNEHWKENLQRVIDMGIPHLSAYALTVEPKTPLAWQIAQGAVGSWQLAVGRKHSPRRHGTTAPHHHGATAPSHKNPVSGIRYPVSDDQASEQFEILMDLMEQAGYIQYEISNFCLPGYESIHNSNYWKGTSYLGLGPSAHSYNGTSRRWNISNLTTYIQGIQSGKPVTEEEVLTPIQQYNEYIMTSLRTIGGTDLHEITQRFGPVFENYCRHQAIRHLASGHLAGSSGIYTLTRKGKFLSDGIAADLFMVENRPSRFLRPLKS